MPNKTLSSRTVPLNAGMYIARIQQEQAIIAISIAPQATSGSVDFFSSESVNNNILQKKSDCIVIRVVGGSMALLVTGSDAKDLLALKIDRIVELKSSANAVSNSLISGATVLPIDALPGLDNEHSEKTPPIASLGAEMELEKISLAGHIEWKGDVQKSFGEILGDPSTNNRLEGFSIEWQDKPENVDIAYSCIVEGMGQSPVVLSGDYVGTRGRNAAILGVSFSLIGKASTQYELEGSVVFAGVDTLKLKGGHESRGPTGQEQLVALVVKVLKKHSRDASADFLTVVS